MEQEPSMHINFAGQELDLGRENATLFTFLGRAALNHVFIYNLSTQGEDRSGYIFNGIEGTHQAYQQMADYMLQNEYLAILNNPDVSQYDIDAFEGALSQVIANNAKDLDEIPDWMA